MNGSSDIEVYAHIIANVAINQYTTTLVGHVTVCNSIAFEYLNPFKPNGYYMYQLL
jgi:hypothetical protein